jgi:hypothetical protein
MSTILKALQKVEEGVRQQDETSPPPGESGQIWGKPVDQKRRRKFSIRPWLMLLVGVAGGLAFLVFFGTGGELRKVPKEAEIVPVPIVETVPTVIKTVREVRTAPASEVVRLSEQKPRPILEKKKQKTGKAAISINGANSPKTGKKVVSPNLSTAASGFIVSGIAYQADRSVCFAIINDTALGEGEAIQGAVVQEILEDRVRLEKGGAIFEVLLSKKPRL